MTTQTELHAARLRALRKTPIIHKRADGKYHEEDYDLAILASHDAVLEAASIPISKLLNGTWQAVPKEAMKEMLEFVRLNIGDGNGSDKFYVTIYNAFLAATQKVKP